MTPQILDSGQRQEFDTGSRRDTSEGKGRCDLLPAAAMLRLAVHFQEGAKKYGDRNWELGQPLSRYIDSALRHILKGMMGAVDEPHFEAALWNLGCFVDTRLRIKAGLLPAELDDLPDALEPKALELLLSVIFPGAPAETSSQPQVNTPHRVEDRSDVCIN